MKWLSTESIRLNQRPLTRIQVSATNRRITIAELQKFLFPGTLTISYLSPHYIVHPNLKGKANIVTSPCYECKHRVCIH